MAPTPHCSPAGIVFRRLDADPDRRQAARLLGPCPFDDHDGTCVRYGLCDLTAEEADGLAGVAVVRPSPPATARLCGLAVSGADPGDRLGRRLVCEVADRLRASGVEEIDAPPTLDSRVAALLAQLGFTPAARKHSQGRGPGWLWLPL